MSMHKNQINRRDFLTKSTLFAFAVSMPVPLLTSCKDDGKVIPANEPCNTTADILGPFYKAGSPLRENIVPTENTAPSLIIKGKVYDDCDVEVENALVEIWNANMEGDYDTSNDFKFRGSYKTSSDGTYRFETIIPGRYLNGNDFRPSHIHFRITASNHQELVSQIYFKNDPFLSSDPWASDPKAAQRILAINKDINGTDTVSFDIYLKKLS